MAEIKTVKVVIQFRRATTEEWKNNENTIPYVGEPCYDLDLCVLKIGDGKTPYKDLKAIGGVSMSEDGLSLIVENLQADVEELQELVGGVPVETQINEAIDGLISESELQDILNLILNN